MGLLACATSAPPPAENRYSPERMRGGPSLQETGRFGVMPISSAGVRIEDARPQATSAPLPATPAPRRRHRKGHETAVRRPARGER